VNGNISQLSYHERDQAERHLTRFIGCPFESTWERVSYTDAKASKYFNDCAQVLSNDNPLFVKGVIGPQMRKKLIELFVIDNEGFRHFAGHLAACAATKHFPSLQEVLSIVNAVADVMGTQRATKKRKSDLQYHAGNVWAVVKLHINSSNFDHQDAKYIDKVGKALIRVDSQIEEYSYVSSTSASAEANNPPMQPSIDSLSAEESAQIRISSFGRMKASVAKLLQIATEFYSESDTNVKKLQAALDDATKTNEIAVKDAESAISFLKDMEHTGLAPAIDNAAKKATFAEQFESSTKTALEDATVAYNVAIKMQQQTNEMLEEIKSQHSFAANEIECAKSYLQDIQKEKNEMPVVVAESSAPKEPALKKPRRSTRSNRVSLS
jgi:hypothetical protein